MRRLVILVLVSGSALAQPTSNNCQFPSGPCVAGRLTVNGPVTFNGDAGLVCVAAVSSGGKVDMTVPAGDIIDLAGGTCGGSGSADNLRDAAGTARFSSGVQIGGSSGPTLTNNATLLSISSSVQSSGSFRTNNGYADNSTQCASFAPSGTGTTSLVSCATQLLALRSGGGIYENGAVQHGAYQTLTTADTSVTAIGLPAPTLLADVGGTAADTTDTKRQMVKYTTSGVANGAAAVSGPFTTTIATRLPLQCVVVRTDPAAVTAVRYYVGLAASSLDQVATLAAANTIANCIFRFDTTIGDTDWMAESSDATTASATDTTVAVASATTFVLCVDATLLGECDYYINGSLKVSKTTNPPLSTTVLGMEASATTLGASARSLSIGRVDLFQQ